MPSASWPSCAVGGLSGLQRALRRSSPSPAVDLNDRLFSVSGNGRSEQLRVGWDSGLEQPVVGNGAGTFEYLWYQARPNLLVVRDGHSLYMETFAELGLVGVALLVGALLVLARRRCSCATTALRRLRARSTLRVGGRLRVRLALGDGRPDAHGAACGFGWACCVGASSRCRCSRGAARVAVATLTSALSVLAVWSLVGNQALFAGREALIPRGVERGARRRRTCAGALALWSHEPDIVLGDAAAGLGDREGALRVVSQMPSRRIRATGLHGSAWPRSYAAPRETPRTTGCAN